MKHILTRGVIAATLALAIAVTALPAPSVHAQSTQDLQAQIAALLAQVQALQAQLTTNQTTAVPKITLTRNLTLGMTGSDVQALQQFLNSDPATVVALAGAGSKGNETMYFGPATRAAVIKFQNKYSSEVLAPVGLTQGTGYVGPSTRAKIHQLSTSVTPTPGTGSGGQNSTPTTPPADPDSDPVVREEGDVTVTRGSEHTSTLPLSGGFEEIYSIDIKAEDSAMTINRIDFHFDKRPWRYIDTFVLLHEGDEIARIKATEDAFRSVGSEYRLRLSGIDAVVRKGDKDTFVLEARALRGLSSSRMEDTMSVYVPRNGVRAIDTAQITGHEPNENLDPRTFDFRDAEGDGEIVVSLHSDSPESGVLSVRENSNTQNTTVLIAALKAKDSDIDIKEVYVRVGSSEANVTNVVRNLSLVFDGQTIATENVVKNTGSAITGSDEHGNTYTIIESGEYYVRFTDLDGIIIDEDNREQLTVRAEFYKQSGRYANGTTVTVTLRAVEGENVHGEDIVNGNLTTGDNRTFALYTNGVTYSFVSEKAETQGQFNRTGLFTLNFDLTAFGSDIYVPKGADRQTGTTTVGLVGAEYSIASGDGARYALGSATESLKITGARDAGSFWRLNEGSTYRVTLQISLDNEGAVSDFYRAELEALRFRVGSTTGTEHTITSGFNLFETDVVSVRN